MAVLVYIAVPAAILVSWMAAYGTQVGWRYSFGAVLEWLAATLEKVPIPGLFHTFNPLAKAAKAIRASNAWILGLIGIWIATSERALLYFWRALAHLVDWVVHEIAKVAKSAFSMGRVIIFAIIPALFRAFRRALVRLVRTLVRRALRLLRQTVAKLWKWRTALKKELKNLGKVAARIAGKRGLAVLKFLARNLDVIYALIRWIRGSSPPPRKIKKHIKKVVDACCRNSKVIKQTIEKTIRQEAKRGSAKSALLRTITKVVSRVVITRTIARMTVVRGLAGVGLGALRTSRFRNFLKWLTALPLGTLDLLSLLLLPLATPMNLRQFAEYMIDAKEEMVDIAMDFLDADSAPTETGPGDFASASSNGAPF